MSGQRTIYANDEDWEDVQRLVVALTTETGRAVSASEAIRIAVREALEGRE